MKRQISFLWVTFVLFAAIQGCNPYAPVTPTPASALVRIECRNASERQILELLRSGRGRDITVLADGSYLTITAAFSPADTAPGKLAQILQDIHNLDGVLQAEVVENPHPIRQTF
jgi:hypothetical protein